MIPQFNEPVKAIERVIESFEELAAKMMAEEDKDFRGALLLRFGQNIGKAAARLEGVAWRMRELSNKCHAAALSHEDD
jgi:hypothetical protein